MATLVFEPTPATEEPAVPAPSAVLTSGCDGYRAGTTGHVAGTRQGCVLFTPDRPSEVARWARPRTALLVPPGFVATIA